MCSPYMHIQEGYAPSMLVWTGHHCATAPSATHRLLPPPPALPPCSGDSGGNVQFWDGRFGTLLAGFSQHQADVLQLAASADGNMVFAAGACCWTVLLLLGCGALALAGCSAGRRGLLPV